MVLFVLAVWFAIESIFEIGIVWFAIVSIVWKEGTSVGAGPSEGSEGVERGEVAPDELF